METIEYGIWKPSVFRGFEDKLGVGALTKKFKELIGRKETRIRTTSDETRFDQKFNQESREKRIAKLGVGRLLTEFLKRIAPGTDVRKIEQPNIAHGDHIIAINKEYLSRKKEERARAPSDGMITNLEGVPLMVRGADCAPVGIYDPEHQAIGVFHSGWRGAKKGISAKGVFMMKEHYQSNPEKLLAVIGPYADGERFEVDEKVRQQFIDEKDKDGRPVYTDQKINTFFRPNPQKPGHYFFDAGVAIKMSLLETGIPESNIQVSRYSTMSEQGNAFFPSERIEGSEKRDAFAFIMVIKPRSL